MGLSVSDLGLRLGRRRVLDGVSLNIERGSLVGLLGPNGAGKTTLLRCMTGLLAPSAGSVDLDGRPLMSLTRDERARRLAVLFQGDGVGWPMRVREVVALGRLPHRRVLGPETAADSLAIDHAMAMTEIGHLADHTEPTLSSGERMRTLLARALAVESEWLLADEPITALDPAHQLDVMTMLRSVAHTGRGVVAVLHDLTLAARFCDRLIVLENGRIAADEDASHALDDDLLRNVFGVTAQRGTHADGTNYLLPWSRLDSITGE